MAEYIHQIRVNTYKMRLNVNKIRLNTYKMILNIYRWTDYKLDESEHIKDKTEYIYVD